MKYIIKFRWLVLAAWVAFIAILLITQPNMTDLVHQKGNATVPNGYSSSEANQFLNEWNKQSGKGSSSSTALVFYDKNGLSASDNKAIKHGIDELNNHKSQLGITAINDVFSQPSLKADLISKNNKTMIVDLTMTLGNKDQTELSNKLYSTINDVKVEHYYTGDWMINNDTVESSQNGLHKTEYLTVIFILVVLLVVFRSVVAPFVPMIAVGIAFITSQSVVAFLVKWFNFPLSNFTQIFLVAVLFGIGTDYCILLINRLKEEIPKQESLNDAIIKTFQSGGRTVFFSCLAVFIGFACIGFSKFNIYQSAVGVSVGIVFLILSITTVVPILMSFLGTKLFWPFNKKIGHSQSRLWGNMGSFALKRPLISIIIVVIITVPLLLIYHGDRSFNSVGEMSDTYGSVKGYNLIAQNFNPGDAMPTTVVIKNDEPMNHRQYLETIEAITESIKKVAHVKTVRSATQPLGEPIKNFLVPNQAQTLHSGIEQANNGVQKISSGLDDAKKQLSSSQPKLNTATSSIGDLVSGTQSLKSGVVQLQSGLSKIQGGIEDSAMGAGQLKQNLQKLKSGAETLYAQDQRLLAGYQQMQSSLDTLTKNFNSTNTQLNGALISVQSNLKQYIDSNANPDPKVQKAYGVVAQLLSTNSDSPGIVATNSQLISGLKTIDSSMTQANSGFNTILQNQKQLNDSLQQFITGIDKLESGLNQTAQGQNQAITNIPSIANGLNSEISGQQQLKQGFSTLNSQMNQLVNGLGSSVTGLNEISGGLTSANGFLEQLSNSNSSLSGFYIPDQALNSKSYQESLTNYMSKDDKMTKLDVVFDVNPYSQTAINQVDQVRAAVERATKNSPLADAQVAIAGPSSAFNDLSHISNDDYTRTVKFMLIGIGIVLIFLFRSLVMPAYVIGSLILTYYASLSITEKIVEGVMGYSGISWAIPFFGFVLLVALGVDYSIFLMDRFNEHKELPVRDALLVSMKNMGSVILSAAVILGGTFAAMIPSGVTELIEIACIIITGLILYNLLMLPLFVPVMVRIFGNANWWPFKRGE